MTETLELLARIQEDAGWSLQQLQQANLLFVPGLIVGTLLLAQLVLAVWTFRRLGELAHMRERMSRLFDSLALLTDTTETGLATLVTEVQRTGAPKRPAASRSPRSTVARRVLEAAGQGRPLSAIARDESLSENEVHLHLRLAEAGRAAQR
jgi:hypothetical protein